MKKRLDVILVEKGLAQSREKAKALIMSGIVYVDGEREDKAGSTFDEEASFEVRGNTNPYVSRGGLKLDKALKVFPLSMEGKVCIDIGASTGGFTDCMLQHGAVRVYAVDVGHGQLDWKLRNDERVVCMEKTNIRFVKPEDIGEAVDFASVDVSFISLDKVLPVAATLLKDGGEMVCLIKPQFEAGREQVGKKGVVRDRSVHEEVIGRCLGYARESGFVVRGLDFSPVKGPEGNIEYLVYIEKPVGDAAAGDGDVQVAEIAAGDGDVQAAEAAVEAPGGEQEAAMEAAGISSLDIHRVVEVSHAELDK